MSYRISELARRSGFSPSTLRYYETVGLLPEPERTDAGYRVYDETALERLTFIARAKTMGLVLEDIAELVTLWADGPCAPAQDRLANLLEAKAAQVRTQLSELATLAAQLDHLRATLASSEPADRCGPGCGCDVELVSARSPVACSLSDAEATSRMVEWSALLARVTERVSTANGVRLQLPPHPDVVAEAAKLVAREVDCCRFFSFTISISPSGTVIDVVAPSEGRVVLDALFGATASPNQ